MGQELKIIDVLGMVSCKGCLFVDLRNTEEYERGHLRGAINIPYEELAREKRKLMGYRRIYLYCERGNNSLKAFLKLRREGYPVVNLWGGTNAFFEECRVRGKNCIDYNWEKN